MIENAQKLVEDEAMAYFRADVCLGSPQSFTLDEKREICKQMESTSKAIEDAMKADFESLPPEFRVKLLDMSCSSGCEIACRLLLGPKHACKPHVVEFFYAAIPGRWPARALPTRSCPQPGRPRSGCAVVRSAAFSGSSARTRSIVQGGRHRSLASHHIRLPCQRHPQRRSQAPAAATE